MSAPTEPEVPQAVTYREIQEILRTFRDSGWTGMTVELHGMRITVGKHGPPASRGLAPRESGISDPRVGAAVAAPGATPVSVPAESVGPPTSEGASTAASAPLGPAAAAPPVSASAEAVGSPAWGSPPPAPAEPPAPPGLPAVAGTAPAEPGVAAGAAPPGPRPGGAVDTTGCVAVRSPAVGAFWVAPGPGQPPFAQVGQRVAQDEQLAIVEVMKLMNPVVAPVAGTVVQVCAANAELVEYEQVLFWIRPGDE